MNSSDPNGTAQPKKVSLTGAWGHLRDEFRASDAREIWAKFKAHPVKEATAFVLPIVLGAGAIAGNFRPGGIPKMFKDTEQAVERMATPSARPPLGQVPTGPSTRQAPQRGQDSPSK